MDASKRKRLESAGWRVGTAEEFVGRELRYTLPGRPYSWQRDNFVKGRYVKDAKTRAGIAAHQMAAGHHAAAHRLDSTGQYAVDVVAVYPNGVHGDADRVLTLVLDALQGIAYASDRQVKRASVEVRVDRENPRTEVVVRRMEAA